MNRKGLWGKGTTHKGCIGKCKKWELLHFIQHASWVFCCICNLSKDSNYFFNHPQKHEEPYQVVRFQRAVLMRIVGEQSIRKMGERCKK